MDVRELLEIFATVAVIGGIVLALLVGVGTFAPDLKPRVNTFWRSRPISASAWFWSKYMIGAGAMLLTIGLPALAATWWSSVREVPVEQLSGFFFMIASCGLLWLLMFAIAVATTCLVRHTLYASILAVGVVTMLVVATFWKAVTTGEPPSAVYVLGMLSGACLAFTLLGWWLAKRDIVAYQ